MIDWDNEPLFHVALQIFLSAWIVYFLFLCVSPQRRRNLRWGKARWHKHGKGAPVSLYGVLSWAIVGAAFLATHQLAYGWQVKGPEAGIPLAVGGVNLFAAALVDWYADSRRKESGSDLP